MSTTSEPITERRLRGIGLTHAAYVIPDDIDSAAKWLARASIWLCEHALAKPTTATGG